MAPDAARHILELDFRAEDRRRMNELAAKAQAGIITQEEQAEAENFNKVGHILALLQSRARVALKKADPRP